MGFSPVGSVNNKSSHQSDPVRPVTFNLCPATEAERQESESQPRRLEEENKGRARQTLEEGDLEDQENEEEEEEEEQEDEEARVLKRAKATFFMRLCHRSSSLLKTI